MSRKIIVILLIGILALLYPSLALAADPIEYGETVSGYIDNENWQEYWDFYASPGDQVTITMEATSGSLDPWLTLWKQNSSGDWDYLTVDDNSGSGKNAKITYTLSDGGRYVIEATRYGDSSGSTSGEYALTLILNGGGSSGGSGIDFTSLTTDNWDSLNIGCPSGWRCIDNVATRWDNLSTLTFCVVGNNTSEFVSGSSRTVFSSTAFENDISSAISYWGNHLNNLAFREVTCSSNPDFKFGLLGISDLTSIMGGANYVGFAAPPDPRPAEIYIRTDLPDGGYRQNVLAHEIGHGLGLGHSSNSSSIMAPGTPAGSLWSIPLGDDIEDQLANAYPANVSSRRTNNTGFNSDSLEAHGGSPGYATINIPDGASNILPMCFINEYRAKSNYGDNADMGWECTWNIDWNSRIVYFTLNPTYGSGGYVKATALVLNQDAFTVHKWYHFTAYGENSDPICIGGTQYNDFTSTVRNDIYPSYSIPAGGTVLSSVTRYDTDGDDDMSFSLWTGNDHFEANAWDGCGVVEGWVAVISPANSNNSASNCWHTMGDYSPYSSGTSGLLNTLAPSCSLSLTSNWFNATFSSLVTLNAHTDDHFSAVLSVNDNGNTLNAFMWSAYGDSQSEAVFEIISLKSH